MLRSYPVALPQSVTLPEELNQLKSISEKIERRPLIVVSLHPAETEFVCSKSDFITWCNFLIFAANFNFISKTEIFQGILI